MPTLFTPSNRFLKHRRVRHCAKALSVLLPILLLAACSGQQKPANASGANDFSGAHRQTFTSEEYGIAIAYPSDFDAHPVFPKSYLQNGAWKTYAGPKSQGQAIVALVLKGSNDVTDAELRIGASRNAQAIAECTQPSDAVRGGTGHATLDGVSFTTFKAGDAAMSHYLSVRSYRAVHDNTCYAIDLLIYGTNPKVYSPPRKPPFTHAQAFARLQAALKGFHYT
jgi:hypothetical protein